MIDNTFSFNNDVTIKVYTHDNVPTTRYADLIKHLKDEKPVLVLNHIICRIEADDAGLMHAIACAGMMSTLIFSYEVKADRSKKFFRLTFRKMG